MITTGEAGVLRSSVNGYISLAFVATFTFACGLILWHAFFGTNPIEKAFLSSGAAQYSAPN